MRIVTADLVDGHQDSVISCDVQFLQYGGRSCFAGPVRTIRTQEDNALLKQLLTTEGNGAVLVVDGGASLRTALVGDQIVSSAVRNHWSGIVLLGALRDSVALRKLDIGIKALGTNSMKSAKVGVGEVDVVVSFGGASFHPGDWLYSDEDGLLVSAKKLLD